MLLFRGSIEMVATLLENGALVNCVDDNQDTPLHLACTEVRQRYISAILSITGSVKQLLVALILSQLAMDVWDMRINHISDMIHW